MDGEHPVQIPEHYIREQSITDHAHGGGILHSKMGQHRVQAARFFVLVPNDGNSQRRFDGEGIGVPGIIGSPGRIAHNRHILHTKDGLGGRQPVIGQRMELGAVRCRQRIVLVEDDGLDPGLVLQRRVVEFRNVRHRHVRDQQSGMPQDVRQGRQGLGIERLDHITICAAIYYYYYCCCCCIRCF